MTTSEVAGRRVAVVVNPTKLPDATHTRASIANAFRRAGWEELVWLETTVDDPGFGQAREALSLKVDLVCALGGDGTVREVASALVHTGVPLGILPGGTGNLLARQLGLPVDSLSPALDGAMGAGRQKVDVGQMVMLRPDGSKEVHHFLVMSGVGFDAQMMQEAPEALKKRFGWAAYALSGVKNLPGQRVRARLTFDDAEPVVRRVRSVIVANCGRLTGGLDLVPDAAVDDGMVDAVVLSPRGLVGWAGLMAEVLTHHRAGHRLIQHEPCRRVRIDLLEPIAVELDGDPMGEVRAVQVEVLPAALEIAVVA